MNLLITYKAVDIAIYKILKGLSEDSLSEIYVVVPLNR